MDWTSLTGTKSVSGSIARWINNSTLTQTDADSLLQEAQDWIYRRLRHWRMLTAPVPGTLTIGSDSYAFPSDFLEPKIFLITGIFKQFLTLKTPDNVIAAWSYDGNGNRIQQQPMIYYFDQASLKMDSPADQAYPVALIYFQQPAMLSAGNLTNFLTSNCQMLLRRAVMRAASEWTKEVASGQYDRTYWEQACEDELLKIQEESDRAYHSMIVAPEFIPSGPIQNWGLFG